MLVALVGDSHLTEMSPRYTTTKLPPRLRRAGFDVFVAAAGGANSRDVLHQEIPDAADRVVLSVGANDAAPWKRVDLDDYEANVDRLLTRTHARRFLVLGPGPVIESGVARERRNDVVARYSRVLEQVTVAHGSTFVSMAGLLDTTDLADDGVHLNDSGYEKLAGRVLRELGPMP